MAQQEGLDEDSLAYKLHATFNKRSDLIEQLKTLFSTREDLKKEISEINRDIRELRHLASGLSQELRNGSKLRREVLDKLRDIRQKAKTIRFEGGVSPGKTEAVRRQIESLEWRLQTSRLSRDEEKKLVATIAEHESEFRKLRKIESANKDAMKLREEMHNLEEDLARLDELRASAVPQLEEVKRSMDEKGAHRERLSEEISSTDMSITNIQQSLTETQEQIVSLKKARSEIISDIRATRRDDMRYREMKLLEEARKGAIEKLADGKKLTFEEWMLTVKADEG